MKNISFLIVGVLFFGLISCQKKNILEKDELQTKSTITHITDQEVLSNRIISINQPVEFKGTNADELNYVHKWNITPSVIDGQNLSASAVANGQGTIFVGWHTRGEAVNGELMLIDWESLYNNNPTISESYQFEGQEINDLFYSAFVNYYDNPETFLFAAGNAERTFANSYIENNHAMSFAVPYNLSNHSVDFNSDDSWVKYSPGYSANSITHIYEQNHVVVSTGSNGGLNVFDFNDPDNVQFNLNMSNAKHYDRNGRFAAFLYGVGPEESKLLVWDYNTPNLPYEDYIEFTLPFDVTSFGKNNIAVSTDFQHAHLALGDDGVVKVDLNTGEIIARFHSDNGGFCNGVSSDIYNNHVFVAYGSEGLYVLDSDTYEVLGNWDFNGSCNYVENFGPYVVLANGDTDGLILLENQLP